MEARSGTLFAISMLLAAAVLSVVQPADTVAQSSSSISTAEMLPMTCVQAWTAADKRYPEMLRIVTTLAKVSLTNRDLDFPNTKEAGRDVGRGIADDCKGDPHGLLFAFVDKHVRRVAGPRD